MQASNFRRFVYRIRVLLFLGVLCATPVVIYFYRFHTILRQYSCQLPPFPLSLFARPALLPPDVALSDAGDADARILVTMLCTHPSYRVLGAVENHRDYSVRHGYAFQASSERIGESFEDGFWAKVARLESLVEDELEKPEKERLEWIFWTDVDTLVLNPRVPLSTLLPPPSISSNIHLLWSRDDWGPNAGVLLMRISSFSLKLLRDAARLRYVLPGWVLPMREQTALQLLMPLDETVIIPSHWFNSRDWDRRDAPPFHVHFSGKSDKHKVEAVLDGVNGRASAQWEAGWEEGRRQMESETRQFWEDFARRRNLHI